MTLKHFYFLPGWIDLSVGKYISFLQLIILNPLYSSHILQRLIPLGKLIETRLVITVTQANPLTTPIHPPGKAYIKHEIARIYHWLIECGWLVGVLVWLEISYLWVDRDLFMTFAWLVHDLIQILGEKKI